MKRRLLIITAAALTFGGLGIGSAQADTPAPTTPPTAVATSSDYWLCVAVDGVAGTCVGNVFDAVPYPYDYLP